MQTAASRAPVSDGATPSRRLAAGTLLQYALSAEGGGASRALLVIALNRSDRLAALAQERAARVVLAETVRRVESMLRPGDRYALAALDELWLVLGDAPTRALAELAGKTLRDSLGRPVTAAIDGRSQTVAKLQPVVGGIWFEARCGLSAMQLLEAAADNGRHAVGTEAQVLVTPPGRLLKEVDPAQFAAELRIGLRSGELEVFFQPQIDLVRGVCVGAEALVRWPRPDGQSVRPELIAAVAEERGLVGELTQFVLNTALRHLMVWSSQGVDPGVSVNLSSVTLSDPNYPLYVEQALSTWDIAPSRLTLELTEGLIVRNEHAARQFIDKVRAAGCRLALDDFGTGYSSFAYLRKFPMDELKIDQSFVRGIASESSDQRVVRSLVEVAHTFELQALAEGIESPEQEQVLRETGCDRGQGYLFARPLPPFEFAQWYRRFNQQASEAALAAP